RSSLRDDYFSSNSCSPNHFANPFSRAAIASASVSALLSSNSSPPESSARTTKRLEEALDHARQTMARDRRGDWRWRSPDMPAELKAQAVNPLPSPQPPTEKTPVSEAA